MKTNKFLHYLSNSFLIIAVLAFLALIVGWQAVFAQDSNNEDQSTATSSSEALFIFEETSDMLILNVNAGAVDSEASLALDEAGQPAWYYVGPSSTDELDNCNEISWLSIEDKAREVQATLATNAEDAPKRASLSLELREDASDETRYCFRVPLLVNNTEVSYYVARILEKAPTPVVAVNTLIFRPAAPAVDSAVPASVNVGVSDGTAIDPQSWQYARVDSNDDCHADNEEISFSEPSADNNNLELQVEDAGAFFCFRVVLTDSGSQEDSLYKAYQVPGATSETDEEATGGISRAFIVLIVIVIGIIAYIIMRSSKSKE